MVNIDKALEGKLAGYSIKPSDIPRGLLLVIMGAAIITGGLWLFNRITGMAEGTTGWDSVKRQLGGS